MLDNQPNVDTIGEAKEMAMTKIRECEGLLTLTFGNLRVELDRSKVVKDDPGADTPAMVYLKRGGIEYSSTYWCALGTSEVESFKHGTIELTQKQCEWLDSLDPMLTHFLYD